MPGIINSQLPPKPAIANPQAGVQANDPVVMRVEIAAKKILANPKIARSILKVIQGAQDPATGIAKATILLIKQVFTASKGTLPKDKIATATQKILVDVARVAAAAKLVTLDADTIKKAATIVFQLAQAAAKQGQQGAAPPAPAAQPPQAAQPAPPPTPAPAPMPMQGA